MRAIQLKPQHSHLSNNKIANKQPDNSIITTADTNSNNNANNNNYDSNIISSNHQSNDQQPKNNYHFNPSKTPQPTLTNNNNKKQQQSKDLIKKIDQKSNQKTNTMKKPQKSLNVEIIKPQPQQSTKNVDKPLIKQSKTIQTNSNQQEGQAKKSKKKKKKKLVLVQQQEQLSLQEKLKQRTLTLYSQFMHRHQFTINNNLPQMVNLLKESFMPLAEKQIEEQNKIKMTRSQQQTSQQQQQQKKKKKKKTNQQPESVYNAVQVYNEALIDELVERKRYHEDRIYYGVLEDNLLFNDLIWRKEIHSQPKKEQVAQLFNDIHMLVINDVWEGEYDIHHKEKPSKDEIIYGAYKANQIRMAESIIKQKLSNLNDEFSVNIQQNQLQLSQSQRNGLNIDEGSRFGTYKKFDLNSEETKRAEEFVKKMKQQEKAIKQRNSLKKMQQQEEQRVKKQLQIQQQKRMTEQKLQQRRVKLMQKAQERQRQKKYRLQQQKQYEQYLTQHREKTPLFKKNEQDFRQFLLKQHMKKLQVMKQIQKNKRSISKDEIEIHQMKYKQLKELMEQERAQLLKLQQEQIDDMKRSYYKGKFHQSVMGEINGRTVIEQRKSKLEQLYTKRVEYATIVKREFVPKVDQRKKEELQRMIKDLAPKQKDDQYIAQKTKMEGISNLEKLHLMMAQMRAKGKIKKPKTPPSVLENDSKKSRYINYLDEIKSSRMMNSSSMRRSRFSSLDSSKLNRNSLGVIEMQARNLQSMADRKSLFLKNTKHLDMEDYLERKFELEEDYVESARAKMKVLNKYTMGGD